jgi:methylaspartate mutase sigma subunit
MKQVVLAMTESDAHVVGNKLLEIFLEESGFRVNNRGACTPLREVFEVASQDNFLAIILGSQNGHALEDLEKLKVLRNEFNTYCPVILGGNLSVGAEKSANINERFALAGVDYIVSDFEMLIKKLDAIELDLTTDKVTYA